MIIIHNYRWGQLDQVLSFTFLFLLTNNWSSLCRQCANNSFREFNVAIFGLKIIFHFSVVHKLHKPVIGEKGEALEITFQSIFGLLPSPFCFHRRLRCSKNVALAFPTLAYYFQIKILKLTSILFIFIFRFSLFLMAQIL